MNDPLFSWEALADYHTKLERPVTKADEKLHHKAKNENNKDVKGQQKITALNAKCVMDSMT